MSVGCPNYDDVDGEYEEDADLRVDVEHVMEWMVKRNEL